MVLKKLYVVLKATKHCTLRCDYCYESKTDQHTMPLQRLLKCLDEITGMAEDSTIILHGGEPMILGVRYWKTFFEYGEEIQRQGRKISYTIQSNGMHALDDWIDLLKKYSVSIGFSLDGPAQVHNLHRSNYKGNGSFNTVVRHLDRLESAGMEKNCLCVITKESLDQVNALYDFFRTQNIKQIDFLPCMTSNVRENGQADFTLSPEEYAEFLVYYHQLWKSDNQPYHVRTFSDFTETLNGNDADSCHFIYPKICGREVISIDTNGDVYPCDSFAGIDAFCLGNIFDDGLEQIFSSKKQHDFYELANTIPKECELCTWLQYCYGGCLYHRWFGSGKLTAKSFYCKTYKRFFKHLITN